MVVRGVRLRCGVMRRGRVRRDFGEVGGERNVVGVWGRERNGVGVGGRDKNGVGVVGRAKNGVEVVRRDKDGIQGRCRAYDCRPLLLAYIYYNHLFNSDEFRLILSCTLPSYPNLHRHSSLRALYTFSLIS